MNLVSLPTISSIMVTHHGITIREVKDTDGKLITFPWLRCSGLGSVNIVREVFNDLGEA